MFCLPPKACSWNYYLIVFPLFILPPTLANHHESRVALKRSVHALTSRVFTWPAMAFHFSFGSQRAANFTNPGTSLILASCTGFIFRLFFYSADFFWIGTHIIYQTSDNPRSQTSLLTKKTCFLKPRAVLMISNDLRRYVELVWELKSTSGLTVWLWHSCLAWSLARSVDSVDHCPSSKSSCSFSVHASLDEDMRLGVVECWCRHSAFHFLVCKILQGYE